MSASVLARSLSAGERAILGSTGMVAGSAGLQGREPTPASSTGRRLKDQDGDETPGYDYHGLIASTWDLWRDDTADWSDRAFYLDLIRHTVSRRSISAAGPAGSSSTTPRPESTSMVSTTRPRCSNLPREGSDPGPRAKALEQDMQALDLPRRYRTIIGSSSVLQLLAEVNAARRRCGAALPTSNQAAPS